MTTNIDTGSNEYKNKLSMLSETNINDDKKVKLINDLTTLSIESYNHFKKRNGYY